MHNAHISRAMTGLRTYSNRYMKRGGGRSLKNIQYGLFFLSMRKLCIFVPIIFRVVNEIFICRLGMSIV